MDEIFIPYMFVKAYGNVYHMGEKKKKISMMHW